MISTVSPSAVFATAMANTSFHAEPIGFYFDDFEVVPARRPKRELRSISDFPGVLRQPRARPTVPTLDQLTRAEKEYLLRSYGLWSFERQHEDPLKIVGEVEAIFGKCRYFTAVKCEVFRRRELRKKLRAAKIAKHEESQREWFAGGRERAYVRNHPFGEVSHRWLAKLLVKETGMGLDQGDYVPSSPQPEQCAQVVPLKQRWNRCCSKSDESQVSLFHSVEVYFPALRPRSIMLLTKLRAYVRVLRTQTLSEYNACVGGVPVVAQKGEVGMPQMAGIETSSSMSSMKTENVVLTESNPAPPAVAASQNRFSFDWHQLCSTEKSVDYSNLTDRFTYVKTLKWDNTQVQGVEFHDAAMDLPCDFVNTNLNGNMPMFVPFKIHRYFKSDIEIKIHVNSNKFQVGQLQFSWHYMEKYDGNPLDDMFSRSQLPHVLVNAGASNEATLYIPFKYVQPYMTTRQRVNDLLSMYMGSLRCFVVAPLAVGEGGPPNCNISIFIRFPNAEFTGLADGSLALPQMEAAAAAMVATAVVDRVIGDRNGDNPSNNVNPSVLVPTATHSWSAGTGLREQVMSLRLDHNTVGVGRVGIDMSESSIGVPCRTFSMLKPFTWKMADTTSNSSGTLLWSIDAHPQIEKGHLHSVDTASGLNTYAAPPVSVVAGMFKQWRGSLEFRFDIIASQFHTGRLFVSYIPGFYGDASKITLDQARNSSSVEIDIQDSTSFTFRVPYISDRVFWPRRYTGPHKYGENNAPSKLVIFVLNPLIPMQNIVNTVTIVPYVRAGEDFEVSVPVQPANGLSDNPYSLVLIKNKIYPFIDSGHYVKTTNYRLFASDSYLVMYRDDDTLGTVLEYHGPEAAMSKTMYMYGKAEYPRSQITMVYKDSRGVERESTVGFCVLYKNDAGTYWCIPFPNTTEGEARAKKVAYGLHKGLEWSKILADMYPFIRDGSHGANIPNLQFIPQYVEETDGWELVGRQQMEPRFNADNLLEPTSSLPSTSCGGFNYNESFSDLKDVARRYQLYAKEKVTIKKSYSRDQAVAVFPCIPHGLALEIDDVDSVFNVSRDGHIPLISSSYIYFRGSLRFRIVFASDSVTLGGTKVWIQHHPDGDCRDHKMEVYPDINEEDGFKSHTYGFYIQAMNINSIIEFEVPFYQSGMYGLLRKPSRSAMNSNVCTYFTLGNIVVGFDAGNIDKAFDATISVYYSIGDDFSFNVFRGFPRVVYTDEVWPDKAKKVIKRRTRKAGWASGLPQMEETVYEEIGEPEMMRKFASTFLGGIIQDTKEEVIQATTSMVKEQAQAIKDKFSAASDATCTYLAESPTLVNALGNLLHVLANPSIKTVAISIANVFVALLTSSIVNMLKFVNSITQVLHDYWNKFCGDDTLMGVPQMEECEGMSENSQHMLCSVIFSSVAVMLGYTACTPKSFPDLLKNINGGVSLVNNVMRFVQNSSELIIWCVKYINKKVYPDLALVARLENEVPAIQDWYKECIYLLDVRNKSKYLYDRNMMNRVFDSCTIGNLLISSGITRSTPAGKLIFDTHKEIRALQANLFERGAHPDVRFETFPLWITGEPGIGKSFMIKRFANDLLKKVGFSAPGSLIYEIPSGAKYWSGCQNPPVLVSDDLFQVNGTKLEEEIANLFLICSSSVLNPPMAAVEDKERRLNPLLYFQLCNYEFPILEPQARCVSAIYRRRKFLIKVRLCENIRNSIPDFVDASQVDPAIRDNLGHLEFCLADNVKDPATTYSQWMSYDALLHVVGSAFENHYLAEQQNFKQRMIDMYSLDPNFEPTNLIHSIPELDEKGSLKEQIEFLKEHIQNKLDAYEDPSREPVVWDYIRKSACYVKNKLSGTAQMPEPEIPVDERNKSGLELNHPALYEAMKRYAETHKMAGWDFEKGVHELGFLSNQDQSILDLNVELAFEALMQSGDYRINEWFTCAIKEYMTLGAFSTLEYLQFFLFIHRGGENIMALLEHGAGGLSLRPVEKYKVAKVQRNDPADYHNVQKKKALRSWFSSLRFCTGQVRYETCMREAFKYFWQDLNIVDFNKLVAKENLNSNFVPLKGLLTNVVFSPSFENLYNLHFAFLSRKNDESQEVVTKFKNSFLKLYMYENFFFNLCIGQLDHKCSVSVVYNYMKSSLSDASYCSVRDKLTLRGVEMSVCNVCMYSNQMLYYLFALGAASCATLTYCSSGAFGREELRTYEYNDIKRALRKRSVAKSQNLFMRFGRWLKCLFMHALPDTVYAILTTIRHRLPSILVALTAVTGISYMAGAFGGTMMGLYGGAPEIQTVVADKQANYFKFDHPKHPVVQKVKFPSKSFNQPQLSSASRVAIHNKLNRNFVKCFVTWIEDGKRATRHCNCLMLRGRAMLILRHYIEEYQYLISQGAELEIFLCYSAKDGTTPCKVAITWEHLISRIAWCSSDAQNLTSNFGIAILPNFVPQFPDIVRCFAKEIEHSNAPSMGDLYVLAGQNSFDLPISIKKNFTVSDTPTTSAVFSSVVYSYNRQFSGMCGSVLVAPTLGSGNGAIIGIHVAGNSQNGNGYAEPVYYEMFASFFEMCPQIEVHPIDVSEDVPDFELNSNLLTYGTVPRTHAHKESGKTKIVPSLLHGKIFPVKTEVNPLRPGDKRQPPGSHPLRDGCNKHGSGDIRVFDPKLVEEVKEALSDQLPQIIRPIRAEVKPLTLEQAICGDVNVPHFEALKWKSSEGFPLSASRPKGAHDKKWLFELEDGEFGYKLKGIHPALKLQLKIRDECFKNNVKPNTIYVDCLKDYRLSPEKCKIPGKTRIFSIAPVQCCIDFRMYVNDFCASLKKSNISNGIAIGINPDSMDWSRLVNYLFEVGSKIITLDYSNFGPCLMSQLVSASNDVIVEWHRYHGASESHVKRVEWLLDNDILNPVHLSSNLVYQTVNGISSGSPLTGECNSIPNLFYIRLTYLEIMRDHFPEYANTYYFNLFVRLVVYGDDLIMSVSDDISELFNAITIRDYLAKHGIKVTPAQKDSEMVPYTSIYDASFLKRSFKEHPFRPGVWLAPIEVTSIEECVNWSHACDNPQEAMLETCRASLDLAYGRGPAFYNAHYQKLKRALNDIGLVLNCKNWNLRDAEIFDDSVPAEEKNAVMPWYYRMAELSL